MAPYAKTLIETKSNDECGPLTTLGADKYSAFVINLLLKTDLCS